MPAPDKTFCEYFAGIGPVRKALEATDWRSVYANDIDPKKRRQYQARFGDDELIHLLRTPRGGSARQIVVAIDAGRLRMRWMSPRECARLQGADDYPLAGTRTDQLFGFGDAVCVPVVRWIDRHVLTPAFDATVSPARV